MVPLTLPDGRVLEYDDAGGDGTVVLFHHGTPSSGLPMPRMAEAARSAGLRLVTYSRAGYGGSGRHPGRSIADVVPDLEALLDHLEVERCVTLGWSGGGPHALAMAALAPGRVVGATSLAGCGPYGASGLDFLAGMGEANVEEFGAAAEGEPALRTLLDQAASGLADADAATLVEEMSTLLPLVDRDVLTGELGEWLAASTKDGLRSGPDGWLDDDLAFVASWGFDVAGITVPTAVWQGDLDLMVPFAHGEWLVEQMPGTHSHLLTGEGHLSIALDPIMTELAGWT